MCTYFTPRESLKQKAYAMLKYNYSEQYIDAVLLSNGSFSTADVRQAIKDAREELKNSN